MFLQNHLSCKKNLVDNVITTSENNIYVISGVIALESRTKVIFDLGGDK